MGNNNMSIPCLIMQYKPSIVELPPTKEAYNKYCSTSTPYMHSLNQQFNPLTPIVHFCASITAPRTRPFKSCTQAAYRGVPYSIGISSLQRMTSSLQYGNRTFTARVTFRERSHTIVRALDGHLSRKRTNVNEYLHALQVQVATWSP